MRSWLSDKREAPLEDLAHQVQSLLNLQSGGWKNAEKEGQ